VGEVTIRANTDPPPAVTSAERAPRRVLGVLLALTLATVAVVAVRPGWVVSRIGLVKDGELTYDLNADGKIDHVEIWRRGVLLEVRQDTNGDGRLDSFSHERDGQASQLEFDLDFDGQIDYRATVGVDGRETIEVLRDGHWSPFIPSAENSTTP